MKYYFNNLGNRDMSDEGVPHEQASDLKPTSTSSFSVTDILSPLEVVANHQDFKYRNENNNGFMGPSSPEQSSAAANNGSAASEAAAAAQAAAIHHNFSSYSSYSPRSGFLFHHCTVNYFATWLLVEKIPSQFWAKNE